jgi:hypothetical protein
MELLANHVARPLATKYKAGLSEPVDQILLQLTYHVPNDSHGRWNPLVKACQLPVLAKSWAEPNVAFPWQRGKKVDWPSWTMFDAAALRELAKEMERLTKDALKAVPAKLFADSDEDVDECRKELWSGLERLRAWVGIAQAPEDTEALGWAKRGNALMLLMDGDQ